MFRDLKEGASYNKTIAIFSVFTFIFGVGSCFLIELLLPLAASFCASLFVFENPRKRIFSYIVPALVTLINLFINGWYFIVGAEFIVIAVLLAVLYVRKSTKAETSFYLTAVISLFIIAFFAIYPIIKADCSSLSSIVEFYKITIERFRATFVDWVSSYQVTLSDGTVQYIATAEEALLLFNSAIYSIPALIISFAFLLCGLTVKLFSRIILGNSKRGILSSFLEFLPSSPIAWFYVLIAVFSFFTSTETVFEIVVLNVNIILMIAFAYVGFTNLKSIVALTNRKSLFYVFVIAALIFATSTAIQVLSYFGAYFTIALNAGSKLNKKQ